MPSNSFPHKLYDAAERGNVDALVRLLALEESKQPDVNWRGAKGRTPLLVSCRRGAHEFTLILLNAGAKPNVGNDAGVRPIHVAAAGGHAECVRHLLIHGADVGLNDNKNRTPLNYAAEREGGGIEEVLRLLKLALLDKEREHKRRTAEGLRLVGAAVEEDDPLDKPAPSADRRREPGALPGPESSGPIRARDPLPGLEAAFEQFCSLGSDKPVDELDKAQFARLCKDAKLLDPRFTKLDVAKVFAKADVDRFYQKGRGQLNWAEFNVALQLIATKKGWSIDEVQETLGAYFASGAAEPAAEPEQVSASVGPSVHFSGE